MKNKIIQLVILTFSFIVIIIIVNTFRNNRENRKSIENSITEIRSTPDISSGYSHNNEIKKIENKDLTTTKISSVENLHFYINDSFINSNEIDVFVSIINEEGIISSYLSNAIAEIYTQAGYKGRLGLFKNSFYKKQYFDDLFGGNKNTIQKLNLKNYTDFLALGKISHETQKGLLVEGSVICTAFLNISVISSSQNSVIKSFSFSAKGNGSSENQAIEYANNKLLVIYNTSYSSLE